MVFRSCAATFVRLVTQRLCARWSPDVFPRRELRQRLCKPSCELPGFVRRFVERYKRNSAIKQICPLRFSVLLVKQIASLVFGPAWIDKSTGEASQTTSFGSA